MKKHNYLRSRMMLSGITSGELAQRVGTSVTWFSRKLCGKATWTMKEAWAIMRELDIDDSDMALAFPDYCGGGEHGEIEGIDSAGGVLASARQCRRVGTGRDNVRTIRDSGRYRFADGRADRTR